ncbi:MAG: hypothetical protein GY838_04125 [bacterium]|nr:hypothetical protein [bacterium]
MSQRRESQRLATRGFTLLAAVLACGMVGLAAWTAGCSRNEPFDPESVANAVPVATIFVQTPGPDTELNPTSYYERRFSWSGSDRDGWIREYYVSIRTDRDVPAPWDTTLRTDTTLSFAPDVEGNAEALIIVACRDDRGALSDTVSQLIPMRNFPPAVNFQSDYEPLTNMQREIDNSGAEPDTTFWNWGPTGFRFFAFDLDGSVTMDPFFRYTLMDSEPTVTWAHDDQDADPETGWVQVPFVSIDEFKTFDVLVKRATPGDRTLTVAVADEGGAETRFTYSWEVRAPAGPVLWVADNTPSFGQTFWGEALDAHLGAGGWQTYEFLYGFPDNAGVLLATMRLFDAVVWSGGSTSPMLQSASANNGVLFQYVAPLGDEDPGRFMLATPNLVGTSSSLQPAFRQTVLGLTSSQDPLDVMDDMNGSLCLAQDGSLPDMACNNRFSRAWGLLALEDADAEDLYRLEQCATDPRSGALDCHGASRVVDLQNLPSPLVVVRQPSTATAPLANTVAACIDFAYFERVDAIAAVAGILEHHLGVAP